MAPKKNRKRNFFDRLFDEKGDIIRYTHEELFGDEPPKVHMKLAPKAGGTFTDSQRAAMADGLAQAAGKVMLINFAYGEVKDKLPFMRLMACGLLYRQGRGLSPKDVALFLVFVHQPAPGLLDELGYEPTKRPGVYRSTLAIFADQTVIILHELSNALHNATFKIFARSPKARQEAYQTMMRHSMPNMTADMRMVLAQIAALTAAEVDEFDGSMIAAFNQGLQADAKRDKETFTDLSPAEITQAVEEYLRAQR